MGRTVKLVKGLILGAAKGLRIFHVVCNSRWRNQRLLILAYHGISLDDEHEWDSAFYMPQELFRRRLQTLQRGSYSVLPYEEAIERLYAGDLPPRAVALTFDDGTHDFHARACPVLAEFGYPATVYLTTYFAINRFPVFNVLFSYLLWKGRGRTIDLTGVLPSPVRYSLTTKADRVFISDCIHAYRGKVRPGNDQLRDMARRLAEAVGQDYESLCQRGILHLMTPSEVAELPRFGVSVQLHTHRHRAPDDESLFRREIRENRFHIASMGVPLGKLTHFCYPSGYHRVEFFDWLKTEKIRSATTCVTSLASKESLPFALPRLIDTCNITPLEFEGWLTGTSQFLPRR
jgi:peptidoglycan/xylan/chitin deacetylase (PgdA/CDA1 family)